MSRELTRDYRYFDLPGRVFPRSGITGRTTPACVSPAFTMRQLPSKTGDIRSDAALLIRREAAFRSRMPLAHSGRARPATQAAACCASQTQSDCGRGFAASISSIAAWLSTATSRRFHSRSAACAGWAEMWWRRDDQARAAGTDPRPRYFERIKWAVCRHRTLFVIDANKEDRDRSNRAIPVM